MHNSWKRFLHKHQKLSHVLAGWGVWYSTSWVFDNIIYVATIAWLGPLLGGSLMMAIAIAIEAKFLLVHSRSEIDWMGMDALAEMQQSGDTWFRRMNHKAYRSYAMKLLVQTLLFIPDQLSRFILFLLNKGDTFAFIVLSIQMSPFIATAHFRRGRRGPLERRDWTIFFSSGILVNVYWTLRSWGVVVVLETIVSGIKMIG